MLFIVLYIAVNHSPWVYMQKNTNKLQ